MAEAFAGALEWWRDAGVDSPFHDQPNRWAGLPENAQKSASPTDLSSPEDRKRPMDRPAAPAPPVEQTIDRSDWPRTLAEFRPWWLREPWLDHGRVAGRVAPHGEAGARLMVIVPEPEPEDRDKLLSGPHGILLDAMLAAMGIARSEVYCASVLTRHTPAADWEGESVQNLGEVLRHHIALAAPQRMILFGSNILPLIQNDPPHPSANLRKFNHEGQSIPMLAARSLALLSERPRWKEQFWQAWLEWADTD